MGTSKTGILPQKKQPGYSFFVVCLLAAGFLMILSQSVLASGMHDKDIELIAETELTNDQGAYSELNAIQIINSIANRSLSVDSLLAKERAEKSDREIKQDIENELHRSPFVDIDMVTVTVKDGIATLTGSVESWTAYADAEANAFQGGAEKVQNHLKVGNGPSATDRR